MLICLDYDGVLVDTFDQLLGMAVAEQGAIGRGRTPVADDFRCIETLTFEAIAERIGLAGADVERFAEAMHARQLEDHEVCLFPGIDTALRRLAERHVLAVMTANHAGHVEARLRALGLEDVFATVSGARRGATKATRIAELLDTLAVAPGDAAMVGDAVSDLAAARAAGVKAVAVAWGYQSPSRLAARSPDLLLQEPAELATLVSRLASVDAPGQGAYTSA